MNNAADKQPITLGGIRTVIPILVVIAGLIAGWTVMDQRIIAMQTKQMILEIKIERIAEENVALKVKLAEIGKDIIYIRQNLDEHMRYTQPGVTGNR